MDRGKSRPKQGAKLLTVPNQLHTVVVTLPDSQLLQPPLYLQKAAIYLFNFCFSGVRHRHVWFASIILANCSRFNNCCVQTGDRLEDGEILKLRNLHKKYTKSAKNKRSMDIGALLDTCNRCDKRQFSADIFYSNTRGPRTLALCFTAAVGMTLAIFCRLVSKTRSAAKNKSIELWVYSQTVPPYPCIRVWSKSKP